MAIAQVSQKVDRVSSEISQTVSQGQSENARQIAQVRQYVDKRSEITSTTDKKLGDQCRDHTANPAGSVRHAQHELNAMYMLKVQKTKNGIPYVRRIGAGIEDVDGRDPE